MATHDYVIANGTGAAVRADLNDALAAIVSNNSGSAEPTTTYAYQWWADTNSGNLKIRNAANSAWVTIGPLATANFGLAPLASPSFTGTLQSSGDLLLTGTGQLDLPAGTTAQRSGSPNSGMIRFNSSLGSFEGYDGTDWNRISGGTGAVDLPAGTDAQRPGTPQAGMLRFSTTSTGFEGYNGSTWGAIGGGAGGGATGAGGDEVFYENDQTVTTNYTLTTNKNAVSAGPVTVSGGVTVTVPSGAAWTVVGPSTGASGTVQTNDSTAVAYAWAALDVSGGTPSILADDGFASITDDGPGLYSLTFDSALGNTNYAVVATAKPLGVVESFVIVNSIATTGFQLEFVGDDGITGDSGGGSVAVFAAAR